MQPFQLEASSLKGRIIRLGSSIDQVLHQHAYPLPVGKLLGEAMVLAAALGSSLKYEGVFTFQAKGDGPVRMLVADVTNEGGIRGYAKFSAMPVSVNANHKKLLGKGHLAFTVDQQTNGERYQGIVEMGSESLSDAVQHYFRQSEQLPTAILAAVEQNAEGHWRAGCLMLQQMPREGGKMILRDTSKEDDWHRSMLLMNTCSKEELIDPRLSPNGLLYRLFHEEGVRVYEPHTFRHQCRCSETRVTNMLRSLPRKEVEELAEEGKVSVTCEFCNKTYAYDKEKMDGIYM
jgi:molecular chaperone Hsp33